MAEKISVTLDEVNSPKVDAKLHQDQAMAKTAAYYGHQHPNRMPTLINASTGVGRRLMYNHVLVMAMFGIIGALPGTIFWNIAYWNEATAVPNQLLIWSSMIASGIFLAVALAVAESVTSRNWYEFAKCLGIGSVVGLVAGVIFPVAAGILMSVIFSVTTNGKTLDAYTPDDFVPHMFARAAAWVLMGIIVGMAPGISLRSIKKTLLGAVGGGIGGLVGGLVFDPIEQIVGTASISRFFGLLVVGGAAGAAIGLLENAAKTGWLRVTAGLIAGKQFILYRNPTTLGSAPTCEIYLFKDASITPRHAAIRIVPGGFDIDNLQSVTGTFVNGQRVSRARLRDGDVIQIGGTCFSFQQKKT